jgi:hypothetical protein
VLTITFPLAAARLSFQALAMSWLLQAAGEDYGLWLNHRRSPTATHRSLQAMATRLLLEMQVVKMAVLGPPMRMVGTEPA